MTNYLGEFVDATAVQSLGGGALRLEGTDGTVEIDVPPAAVADLESGVQALEQVHGDRMYEAVTDGGAARPTPRTDRSHVPALAFDDEHVDAILDGRKTVTIRYDYEHDFLPYDPVDLVNQNGALITEARILAQFQIQAGWVACAGWSGHETYDLVSEAIEDINRYYPDADIGTKTVLDVLVFDTGRVLVPDEEGPA